MTLRGQSKSTLDNYTRRIALFVIHFNRLPEQVSEDEINEYLVALARNPKSPSRSSFKYMVYGLRYYYRLLGMNKKVSGFNPVFTCGYGIGSEFYLPNDRYLNLEIVSHNIMERRWWEYNRYNTLNQLKVIYASDISDRWQVFAGPVINFQVRNINNEDNAVSPYQLVRYSGKNTVTDMWLGINAGFRFW